MYQWDTEPEAHESYSQSAMAATNVHDLGQGRAGQGKGKGRGYAATAADATRAEAEPPRYTRDYSHVKKTNMFLRA